MRCEWPMAARLRWTYASKIGISEATFYTWKKRSGELGVSELRKLRQLEDENVRLLRIKADLTLDMLS